MICFFLSHIHPPTTVAEKKWKEEKVRFEAKLLTVKHELK